MAENENLASILVKSGLISIFTNSPMGYFSKFSNDWSVRAGECCTIVHAMYIWGDFQDEDLI